MSSPDKNNLVIKLKKKVIDASVYYDIVATNYSKKDGSEIIEHIGRFNATEKKKVLTVLNEERFSHWLKSGAIPTRAVVEILDSVVEREAIKATDVKFKTVKMLVKESKNALVDFSLDIPNNVESFSDLDLLKDKIWGSSKIDELKEIAEKRALETVSRREEKRAFDDQEKQLELASREVYKIAKQGKSILFVGNRKKVRELVEYEAKRCRMPFVTNGWLNGLLTHFNEIRGVINVLDEIENLKSLNVFDDIGIQLNILSKDNSEKLLETFFGLSNLNELPGAVIIVDSVDEPTAISEAKELQIPVVAIGNRNIIYTLPDYVIPAKNQSNETIRSILSRLVDKISQGISEYQLLDDNVWPRNLKSDNYLNIEMENPVDAVNAKIFKIIKTKELPSKKSRNSLINEINSLAEQQQLKLVLSLIKFLNKEIVELNNEI